LTLDNNSVGGMIIDMSEKCRYCNEPATSVVIEEQDSKGLYYTGYSLTDLEADKALADQIKQNNGPKDLLDPAGEAGWYCAKHNPDPHRA
jgi:hypothetical protein